MTCIVGIVEDGKVYIGGDSAGVAGWAVTPRKDVKVFKTGEYLIGFTSSFRMGQLLRFSFAPPARTDGHSDEQHMMTAFVDAARQCFKDGGYLTVEKSVEEGGFFLVGYRGVLYYFAEDFQTGISLRPYEATGSGAAYALGSLHSTEGYQLNPRARIQKALEAATEFCASVRPPFIIEEL